eukprot:COSAG01_NODE_71995_length_254_cov_0.670968_1_plen_84_part_11
MRDTRGGVLARPGPPPPLGFSTGKGRLFSTGKGRLFGGRLLGTTFWWGPSWFLMLPSDGLSAASSTSNVMSCLLASGTVGVCSD